MSRVQCPYNVQDVSGVAEASLSVEIRDRTSNVLIPLYAAETGTATVANPLSTDGTGSLPIWVDPGKYNIIVHASPDYTRAWDAAEGGTVTGPTGPAGPKGDKGDKGDPGDPGSGGGGGGGGVTYYVSNTGLDTSDGKSLVTAWKTVGKVNAAALNPGDQVLFNSGQTFGDAALAPTSSGTDGAPIHFGTYGPGGNAVITKGIAYVGQHWLVFEALTVIGAGAGNLPFQAGNNAARFSHHGAIRRCVFDNGATSSTGVVGIVVYGDDWVIEGNTVQNTGDNGMYLVGDSHRVRRNLVQNTGLNTSIGSARHGIYFNVTNGEIADNQIYNSSTDGISVRYRNAVVRGNTIVGCQIGIAYFETDTVAGTCEFVGNYIGAYSVAGIYVPSADGGNTTLMALAPFAQAQAAATATVTAGGSTPAKLVLTPITTDSFNRANGTLATGGWTATSDGSMAISSNEAIGTNSAIKGNYRGGEIYGDNHYSKCAIGSVNNVGGSFVGPTVRNQSDGSTCYAAVYLDDGTPPHVNIYKRTAPGAFTLLAQHNLGVSLGMTAAQTLTLIAEGSQLTVQIDGVGVFTLSDTTIPSGGAPGITSFDAVTLDNWEGGNAQTLALATASVTDNFNRADAGMTAGQANWQVMTGYPATDVPIVSNQLVVNPSGAHQAATRTDSFPADQYSAIQMGSTVPTVGAAGFIGMTLRVNSGLNSGYLGCYFNQPDNLADGGRAKSSYRIYRLDSGTSHLLAACGSTDDNSTTFNPAGTQYAFVAEGSRLSFRVNGKEVVAVTDTTYATGKPGVQCYPASPGSMTADNWSGGSVH